MPFIVHITETGWIYTNPGKKRFDICIFIFPGAAYWLHQEK